MPDRVTNTSTRDELYQEVRRLQSKLAGVQNAADIGIEEAGEIWVRQTPSNMTQETAAIVLAASQAISLKRIANSLNVEGNYRRRAENLEAMLGTLVDACERSGVTQIPAGSRRPDLEQLRAIIDSAKCFLP